MRSSGMDDGLPERMGVDLCHCGVVGLEADLVLKRGAVCLRCWHERTHSTPLATNLLATKLTIIFTFEDGRLQCAAAGWTMGCQSAWGSTCVIAALSASKPISSSSAARSASGAGMAVLLLASEAFKVPAVIKPLPRP